MQKNCFSLFMSGLASLLACSTAAHAGQDTWEARGSNNDMNNPANWDPNIPGSSDDAIFDDTIRGINTNPTTNSTPFTVSSFVFPNDASVFNFNFNNTSLTFTGTGITGNQTSPNIQFTNTNNGSFPGNLLFFSGSSGTSGKANITITNNGTLTGNHSDTGLSTFNSQIYSSGPFTIASRGIITSTNTGNDSAHGTGNNGTANSGSSQLSFDQSFTANNNVSISVSNSGTFTGTNTAQGDAVSVINGSQFLSSGAFQAGNNFTCDVLNEGNDSSLGVGLSNIGQLNAAQMLLGSTGIVGNNCAITVNNTGINSSQTTTNYDSVGYLNDQQFMAAGAFQAGDDFSLAVSNTGTDTSSGYGRAQVAAINSNSGTTGNQILFQQGGAFGDNATINAANSGSYSGSNNAGGPNAGAMNLQQIAIGDFSSPGSYNFNAGNNFVLKASNDGVDSGIGSGFDVIGDVSTDQVIFYTPCSLGDNGLIHITNNGNFSGQASASYVNVGSVGGSQINCLSTFQAGDNFTLAVTNSGTNTGSGIGDNFIGDLIDGQQASFNNGLMLGHNGNISISNSGLTNTATLAGNQTGSMMGYGKQLLVKGQFHAGDNLVIKITNSGLDESTGQGGNYAGFINNDTVDHTASQMHLDAGGTVGNNASITLSNIGIYQGSTAQSNAIGVFAGQQFYAVTDFQGGNHFNLTASNIGTNNASGQSNNSIGVVGNGGQVEFGGACTLGNHAAITLLNNGVNNDTTGQNNTIGFVNGPQMQVGGNFTAGTSFYLNVTNTATNLGNLDNSVGTINGHQISFAQGCTLDDRSIISAFNSGTVSGSQIVFGQGFDIVSGKALIVAENQGTIQSFGILIQGSNAGGAADIVLGNTSLYVETTLPTFTIASLTGDSTSSAQSNPQLIINTDAETQAEFAGAILDFPSVASTLMKTGPGTQKLSGTNTYTGLTTVQEGVLVLTGSLGGDVLINSAGTLKGTGRIVGTTTNLGIISPGESIGTLHILGNYHNDNGDYDMEVSGSGASDLIKVSGRAHLNGGTVAVSSSDGTYCFNQPYTIVKAGSVVGTFTEAITSAFITPLLDYGNKHVYLTLQPNLSAAADTHNQRAAARKLDLIAHPDPSQTAIISDIANLPQYDAQQALESLSGYQHTDDAWAAEISSSQFIRRLYDPLRDIVTATPSDCCGNDKECLWTAWSETGGGTTCLHGNREAHGFNLGRYEVTAGLQNTLCEDITAGIAGSYEYDCIHYKHGSSGRRNIGFAGLYGLYRPAIYYVLADVTYGYSCNRIERSIHAGALHSKARSKPKISQVSFYGEIGVDWCINGVLLQPFAGIQTGKSWRTHVTEENDSGLGLDIKKHQWTSTSTRLGVHLTADNFYQCVDVSLDVAWDWRLSKRKNRVHARFIEFGKGFDVRGIHNDNHGVDYALTIGKDVSDCVRAYLEISGEAWRHAATYDVLAGVLFSW